MAKIRGIGGVFFRSKEPKTLQAWYAKYLGLEGFMEDDPAVMLKWRNHADPNLEEVTIWAPFPRDTEYFGDSSNQFMMNYIVDDLDAVLKELREAGATVDEKVEDLEYGRFGWATDPEGNRFELWQPPKAPPKDEKSES
jgi:catechol 2,3-dioxygenase-like lactoylglutathione lyase family enzyme